MRYEYLTPGLTELTRMRMQNLALMLGSIITCSWIAFTWYFLYYEVTQYVINPHGNWTNIPGICCELKQKIPLYMHIIGSVMILVLGPLQAVNFLRKLPTHKYTGALYAVGCVAASVGGLTFIFINGTVGGWGMSLAFGVYGFAVLILTVLVTVNTFLAHQFHWELATRLFWLASASPFYRLLYIIACAVRDCSKITFTEPIDYVFDWLFFIIPVLIAEIFIFVSKKCRERTDYVLLYYSDEERAEHEALIQ